MPPSNCQVEALARCYAFLLEMQPREFWPALETRLCRPYSPARFWDLAASPAQRHLAVFLLAATLQVGWWQWCKQLAGWSNRVTAAAAARPGAHQAGSPLPLPFVPAARALGATRLPCGPHLGPASLAALPAGHRAAAQRGAADTRTGGQR